MSTRACVAIEEKNGKWKGVYNHWDGYPSGLGKEPCLSLWAGLT
jgi:hypothetical protein